jgi:hypothetical protein
MTRTCSRGAYGLPALHHRKIPNEPTTLIRKSSTNTRQGEFTMKTYRILFGGFVRMYADSIIEAENDEAARQAAIQEFKARNDELDWYDAQYDNIAQPSIVSIEDAETKDTILEGFDFPATAADAREYAADKLLAALQNLMPDIESEIDHRQNNDKEWIELDRKAAEARAAIAEATAIKDQPSIGETRHDPS